MRGEDLARWCIRSWRLLKPKLAAHAWRRCTSSLRAIDRRASCRSGRLMPYLPGAVRNWARASSHTW